MILCHTVTKTNHNKNRNANHSCSILQTNLLTQMARKGFTLWHTLTHTHPRLNKGREALRVEHREKDTAAVQMVYMYCKLWTTEFINKSSQLYNNQNSYNQLKVIFQAFASSSGITLFLSGSEVMCACLSCYHCYCVWHSPAAQRATSSAPSPSSHRSSGGGRAGATRWGGTGTHT